MCDPCSRDIRSGEANRLLDRHPTTASTAALIPKKRHHLQEGRLELNAVLSVVIPATAGLDELSRSAALSSLFLLSKVAETPRSPEELLAITTLPIDLVWSKNSNALNYRGLRTGRARLNCAVRGF